LPNACLKASGTTGSAGPTTEGNLPVHLFRWMFSATFFASYTFSFADGVLDDFISKQDPNYGYYVVNKFAQSGVDVYLLQMTSQQWRDAETFDSTKAPFQETWIHDMYVIVPPVIVSKTATLVIGGGTRETDPYGFIDPNNDEFQTLLGISRATGSVTTLLNQIPNQRLYFKDESSPIHQQTGRIEDEIIAYSMREYVDGGGQDPTWRLLLPMTKAAVKAMDATQSFVGSQSATGPFGILNAQIKDFIVLGGSKRGWTTWLTAAADERVKAIMPLVYDNLNTGPQFEHHFEVYEGITEGFVRDARLPEKKYARALTPYAQLGFAEALASPLAQVGLDAIDPYYYRDRLADISKYIVNSAGDQFFLPDSSQFYFDDLSGPKYLRYVANTSHGLGERLDDVAEGYTAFYEMVVTNQAFPSYSFSFENDGQRLLVQLSNLPDEIHFWMAENINDGIGADDNERDFRYERYGAIWKEQDLSQVQYLGNGRFLLDVPAPEVGWKAYFLEFVHLTNSGRKFTYTTGISVIGHNPTGLELRQLQTVSVPEVRTFGMVGLLTLVLFVSIRRSRRSV
jgi:PhoPQ-activated pathogenicity-related protein